MVNLAKRVRQETGSFCGPAVIEMLLAVYGKEVTQAQVVEACNASKTVMKEGIPLRDLAIGVKKLFSDLVVWEKQNSSVEEIKVLVDKGYPVAVDWQGIFTTDEYGDEIWNSKDRVSGWWARVTKAPVSVGDQGHYCVVTEVSTKKGVLKYVDPYGHYAGKDRFVAIWEFEERWWDDRLERSAERKMGVVLENKLMFVVAPKTDVFLKTVGMTRI